MSGWRGNVECNIDERVTSMAAVVRKIRVAVGEMTCTVCGETTTDRFCRRCNGEADEEGDEEEGPIYNWRRNVTVASQASLVPTVSYLHEDEYVLAT